MDKFNKKQKTIYTIISLILVVVIILGALQLRGGNNIDLKEEDKSWVTEPVNVPDDVKQLVNNKEELNIFKNLTTEEKAELLEKYHVIPEGIDMDEKVDSETAERLAKGLIGDNIGYTPADNEVVGTSFLGKIVNNLGYGNMESTDVNNKAKELGLIKKDIGEEVTYSQAIDIMYEAMYTPDVDGKMPVEIISDLNNGELIAESFTKSISAGDINIGSADKEDLSGEATIIDSESNINIKILGSVEEICKFYNVEKGGVTYTLKPLKIVESSITFEEESSRVRTMVEFEVTTKGKSYRNIAPLFFKISNDDKLKPYGMDTVRSQIGIAVIEIPNGSYIDISQDKDTTVTIKDKEDKIIKTYKIPHDNGGRNIVIKES